MTPMPGGAMGRYAVTLVFEVGGGKMPRGADVLDRMRLAKKAIHRFSYCDGRSLTVIVDWSAVSADQACTEATLAVRLVWTQLTGVDPGQPLSTRARPLKLPPRVSAGLRMLSARSEVGRRMHLGSKLDWLDLPGVDDMDWPEEPDDDGGLAGVREPRRPKPGPPPLARALDEPTTLLF
jgi:hypothetical protein